MPAGRPTDYSPEICDAILDLLADGESLRAVCRLESMPDRETVRRWARTYPEFAANIAHAREEGQHASVDLAREMALGATPENWQLVQFQVKTIQWEAGKRNRKQFGEKVDSEVTGQVGVQLLNSIPRPDSE